MDKLSFIEPKTVIEKPQPGIDYLILFKGNSITRHGWNADTVRMLGWNRECGMAASSEAYDYAHLLCDMIQTQLPHRRVRPIFGRGGRPDLAIETIKEELQLSPSLIIVQNGEHSACMPYVERFAADYGKLLDTLAGFPVITVGIWNPRCREEFFGCTDPDYDRHARTIARIQAKYSADRNIPFASVTPFENDPANTGTGQTAGVRWHPDNQGMRCYAEAIFSRYRSFDMKNSR